MHFADDTIFVFAVAQGGRSRMCWPLRFICQYPIHVYECIGIDYFEMIDRYRSPRQHNGPRLPCRKVDLRGRETEGRSEKVGK